MLNNFDIGPQYVISSGYSRDIIITYYPLMKHSLELHKFPHCVCEFNVDVNITFFLLSFNCLLYIEIYLQYVVYINIAFSLSTCICEIPLPPLSIIGDHMLTRFWPVVTFALVYFRWWMSTNQKEYISANTFRNHAITRKYNASPRKLFYFNCNIFWKNKMMV
jgi:hypothetical protein